MLRVATLIGVFTLEYILGVYPVRECVVGHLIIIKRLSYFPSLQVIIPLCFFTEWNLRIASVRPSMHASASPFMRPVSDLRNRS